MAKKQYLDLAGLTTYDEEIKGYIDEIASGKADSSHSHDDYLLLSGGTLTGALKLPKLSATNTSAYIGSMTTPFQQIYVKQNYLQDGVNETIDYGSFRVQTNGTTSTTGKTQLNVGNSTASGKAGNSQGFINLYGTGAYYHQIQGNASTNRTLTLPDVNGTLCVEGHTHDDFYTKDETYSKNDLKWTLIYDSGSITSRVNSISNINISGYKKFKVVVKCVNNTNSAARAGSAIFKATDGTSYQFPVWTNLFTTSANTSAGMADFEIINGYLVCSNATRSIKTSNFLSSTEGGTADNLVGVGSGVLKCSKALSNLAISSLDQDSSFYFESGSRVMVWGCNA